MYTVLPQFLRRVKWVMPQTNKIKIKKLKTKRWLLDRTTKECVMHVHAFHTIALFISFSAKFIDNLFWHLWFVIVIIVFILIFYCLVHSTHLAFVILWACSCCPPTQSWRGHSNFHSFIAHASASALPLWFRWCSLSISIIAHLLTLCVAFVQPSRPCGMLSVMWFFIDLFFVLVDCFV